MESLTLFLSGDVMTGRGVDQLFATPGAPNLREDWMHDARDYVALAESMSGAIPRAVPPGYVWGDALDELDRVRPDARIINLETSATVSEDFWPDKGIHYRMDPRNVACLTAAGVDVCVLANNHVLDFSKAGLLETLETLEGAGLKTCGAGRDVVAARRPARIELGGGPELLVFSMGTDSSGIAPEWNAELGRPGVWRLDELTDDSVDDVLANIRAQRRRRDRVIVSVHWGSNWGYAVPDAQLRFAHRLIDGGVDLVHGHSSHHPRPIEVYRGRLILYGCGDFIDDYEGIRGFEIFRPRLRAMYFATLDARTGSLQSLRMVPLLSTKLSLQRAPRSEAKWLAETLSEESAALGARVDLSEDGLVLDWHGRCST
jgi:poly-gamma-glutamate synthesis protein (capsule biosynthesis protein)